MATITEQSVGTDKAQINQTSAFRFYSLGIVAANKKRGASTIEVSPIEVSQFLSGELTDNVSTQEVSATDALGQAYTTNVKTTASIQADWIPMSDTNRLTAPDVRRGEVVAIYQFADSDVYHWACLKNMHNLRRLETVTYIYSADPNNPADPKQDNCYYLEISTHDGLVTFKTSKANGEPFEYTMQFNTKEGKFVLTDDIDNYFLLDSEQSLLEMCSSEGSYLQILKKDMFLNVEGDYTRIVKGHVNEQTEKDVSRSTQGQESNTVEGGLTQSAPTITQDAPTILLAGDVSSAQGTRGGSGNVRMKGDVHIEGIITAEKGANFGGIVEALKIISQQDISAPNV